MNHLTTWQMILAVTRTDAERESWRKTLAAIVNLPDGGTP